MSFSGHTARKRFGQHWLHDVRAPRRSIDLHRACLSGEFSPRRRSLHRSNLSSLPSKGIDNSSISELESHIARFVEKVSAKRVSEGLNNEGRREGECILEVKSIGWNDSECWALSDRRIAKHRIAVIMER